MELLVYFVALILWTWFAYYCANKVKKEYPDFNINPNLYAVGAFFIGFIWVMIFLAIKFIIWNKKNN